MKAGAWVALLGAGLMLGAARAAEPGGGPRITLEEVPTAAQAGLEAKAPESPFADAKRVRLAPYRLEVRSGQRLSEALKAFLERERWRLAWEASGDFVIAHGFAVEAPDLKGLLSRVLPAYGLSATLYEGNRVAAVRQAATLP